MSKETPIIFPAEQMPALLAGIKTQARLAIRLPPVPSNLGNWEPTRIGGGSPSAPDQTALWHTRTGECLVCPYGQVGDYLWVQEDFFIPHTPYQRRQRELVCYKADTNSELMLRYAGWSPALSMPRWASRCTLVLTWVHVEWLQDLSEEDAQAEGVPWPNPETDVVRGRRHPTCIDVFAERWDALNNPEHPWNSNPWVWVMTFAVLA